MKKIKTYLISFLFVFMFYGNSFAGTGAASEYKIIIYKIELCDSSSTASACNGAVTLYDGNSGSIDIANTTAEQRCKFRKYPAKLKHLILTVQLWQSIYS